MTNTMSALNKHFRTPFLEIIELILVIFSTYFYQYSSFIPGISLGDLALLLSLLFVLIIKKGKVYTKLGFFFFAILIACFVTSIISFSVSIPLFLVETRFVVFSRWIRFSVYCLVIAFVCFQETKTQSVFKLYKVASVLVSLYTISQFLLYITTGFYLPVNIFPIPFSVEISLESSIANVYRGFGVFSEPSHLVKFLLPSLCISLSGQFKGGEVDYLSFIFSGLAIFISSSLQGIVIGIITVFLYFIFSKKIKFFAKLSFVLLFVVFLFVLIISPIGQSVLERLTNISIGSEDTSTYMRVFRGFDFYKELPTINKFFGVGLGNTANFAIQNNIKTQYDGYMIINPDILNYMSGISSLLVEGGVIALLGYFIFTVKLWNTVTFDGKVLFVQLLLVQLSTSGFFSLFLIFYLFMIGRFIKQKDALQ